MHVCHIFTPCSPLPRCPTTSIPPSPSIQDFSLFPALRMVVCVFLPSLSLLVFIHFAFGVMGDTSACGMRASQDHIPGPCAEPTPVPPPTSTNAPGHLWQRHGQVPTELERIPPGPHSLQALGAWATLGGGGALGGDRHSGTGCEATCRAWGGGCARIADPAHCCRACLALRCTARMGPVSGRGRGVVGLVCCTAEKGHVRGVRFLSPSVVSLWMSALASLPPLRFPPFPAG